MANPLVLKIQSTLDDQGFKKVQVGIDQMLKRMAETSKESVAVASAIRTIGGVIATAFGGTQLRNFIQLTIESERAVVRLGNRLKILGESNADATARSIANFTEAASRRSQFGQTQQLQAFDILLRTSSSSQDALRRLAVAQDLAAGSGRDLTTAAVVLNQAQLGLTRSLTQLTGLSATQIRQFREQGTLIEEVGKRVQGFAERDLQTLGGQLDRLKNRFDIVKESIGTDFRGSVKLAADLLQKIPDPVLKTTIQLGLFSTILIGLTNSLRVFGNATVPLVASLTRIGGPILIGVTALQAIFNALESQIKKDQTSADALAQSMQGVAESLRDIREGSKGSFASIGEETLAVNNTIEFVKKRLDQLNDSLIVQQVKLKSFTKEFRDQAAAAIPSLENEKRVIEEILGKEQARLAILTRAERAALRLGSVSVQQETEAFQALTRQEQQINRERLEEQQKLVADRLRVVKRGSDEEEALLVRLANIEIKLSRAVLDERLQKLQKELEFRKRIVELFEKAITPLPENATESERSKELDQVIKLRDLKLKASEDEKNADLKAIQSRRQQQQITNDEFLQERTRVILEARDREISVFDDIQKRLTDIGDIQSRKNLADETTKRLQELQRQQRTEVTRVAQTGADLRLTRPEQQIIDREAESLKKEIELQRFKIEFNLNLNKEQLERQIGETAERLLRERGFEVARVATAPSGEEVE